MKDLNVDLGGVASFNKATVRKHEVKEGESPVEEKSRSGGVRSRVPVSLS